MILADVASLVTVPKEAPPQGLMFVISANTPVCKAFQKRTQHFVCTILIKDTNVRFGMAKRAERSCLP
jgi:hypothetical protein